MESQSDVTESTQQKDRKKEKTDPESEKKIYPIFKAVPFDKELQLSTPNYESIIESDIAHEKLNAAGEFFMERLAYPDDYTLVQLAYRVYKKKNKGKDLRDRKIPGGWKLLTTAFNNKTLNNYFGAAYWNPKEQRIVVAHGGPIFGNIGVVWADIRGILHNKYVPQMASAITFAHKIKVMVEELNKRENVFLQLSFTGHSLGGWLAQITTLTTKYFGLEIVDGKHLFVKSPKLGYHAHTVVFESPGCKEMLSKIRDNFQWRHNVNPDRIIISDLDITTYLSAPNIFNTCNLHTGTLYRVFIDNSSIGPTHNYLIYSLKVHSIENIVKVFSSPKINEIKQIVDWPFVDKGITERYLDVFLSPIDSAVREIKVLFKGKEGKALPQSSVYNEYEFFHLLAEEIGPDNYYAKPNFRSGYCEIRYQVQKVDKTLCYTSTFSQPELDFLELYKTLRDNPIKKLKEVLTLIGDKADEIQYTLKHFKMDKKVRIIRCKSEDELKKLIRYVKYVIHFLPQINNRIERILRNDPIWFCVEKLNEPFIGRRKELEQLLDTYIFPDKGIAMSVITGLPGVGKSELALKYVREYYSKDNSVIWINAENEEAQRSSFKQLHKDLLLKCRDEDGEENMKLIINDVYQYLTANIESSVFIFDNAENYTAIEKFLPQRLDNCEKVHVLVTSSYSLGWSLNQFKVKHIRLIELDNEEAIQFVKNSLKITDDSQDEEINALTQTLHNFPLALQQAVAYIQKMKEECKDLNREYKISDYLKQYKEEPEKMLSYGSRSGGSNDRVPPHFNEIINKIQANKNFGQQALNMLDTISYFAPNNIPNGIFLNKFTGTDELELIIQQLKMYSMVHMRNSMLNVHKLVQQIWKSKVEEEKREEKVLKTTLQVLTEYMAVCEYTNKRETDAEKDNLEIKEREKIELCTPHVVSVWNHAYKYINLIEEFLISPKKIRIPGTNTDLSVTYFNFIAAGSKYEIVKEIIDKIEEKFPNDCNKVKNLINRRNDDKESALHCAVQNNMEQTVKLLVSKGAYVNAKRKYGWTPLGLAVNNGHLSIAKYLLENGAHIGIHGTSRMHTELHVASKNGYVEIVNLLLSKGADVNAKNKYGWTPLSLAVNNGHLKVVEYLLENGAKLGVRRSRREYTELHIASKNGYVEIVKLLLNNGAYVDILQKGAGIKVPYVNARDERQHTPLHVAVKKNHLEIIKVLLEDERIDVNAETELKRTPLYFAVEKGNLESVKILLKKGANINAKENSNDVTPLHMAVLDGNEIIIRCLLERNEIEVDAQTTEGNTALHLAAENGELGVVEILIQKNADSRIKNNHGKLASDLADENGHVEVKNYINEISELSKEPFDQAKQPLSKNMNDETELHYAADENNLYAVDTLIDKGADSSYNSNIGNSELHDAAERGTLDVLNNMIQEKAELNSENNIGETVLHAAATRGSLDILRYLIGRGADFNFQTIYGSTALHYAASKGKLDIINLLIDNKIDINIKNTYGNTALHDAAERGNSDVTKLLIERGADLNCQNEDGHTALHYAARKGYLNTVKLLIAKKPDLNIQNFNGYTAVLLAAKKGKWDVVQFLIENEADFHFQSKDGETVLHFAVVNSNKNVAKSLIEMGADINCQTSYGDTILHSAAEKGNIDVVKFLIEKGADLYMININGDTALHYAAKRGSLDILKLFTENGADIKCQNSTGETVLHYAVEGGSLDVVKFLIGKGADITRKTKYGNTVLHSAAVNGNIDLGKFLIGKGVDINEKNNNGETVLHYAAKDGNLDLLKLLMEKGADMKCQNTSGEAVLHYAAKGGSLDVVKFLIEKGADITCKAKCGDTILHSAAKGGSWKVIKFLIQKGTVLNIENKDGETVLHYAAKGGSLDVVKFLIRKGVDFNKKNNNGEAVLHYAAEGGRLDIVMLLIKKGADIIFKTKCIDTVLHSAAEKGNIDVVKFLIEKGADFKCQNKYGSTVLHSAAEKGNIDVVKFLIEKGADFKCQNKYGSTVLHSAAEKGNIDVVKLLIEMGADFKCQNDNGDTVLHYAAKGRNSDVVKLLVEKGADIKGQNNSNEAVLHYAVEAGNLDMVKFLIKKGADCNCKNDNDETVLHYAAKRGSLDIVKLLIEKGADLDFQDFYKKTALHYAVEVGNLDIVKLLLEKGADLKLQDNLYKSALHYAVKVSNLDIIKLLIEKAADLELQDNLKKTALHYAVEGSNLDIIKLLIEKGADVDCKANDGNTVLHSAAEKGNLDVVALLIEKGANYKCENNNGYTVFQYVKKSHNSEIVRYLENLMQI